MWAGVYLCDRLYNCTVNPHLDWAVSTQQPHWPANHIHFLYTYFTKHIHRHMLIFGHPTYVVCAICCLCMLIVLVYCRVEGCDSCRSVCSDGRRIPAKLVKVRIDYCSAWVIWFSAFAWSVRSSSMKWTNFRVMLAMITLVFKVVNLELDSVASAV